MLSWRYPEVTAMAIVPLAAETLRRPSPCDHLIQAYTDDNFLAEVVGEFISTGLRQNEGAIIIATPKHLGLFTDNLQTLRTDVAAATSGHQLLLLDAERTLERFTVDGRPDRTAFLEIITSALEHVRRAGYPRLRLYGEMVDLLWATDLDATVELEQLWNEVLRDPALSLLCAYRLDPVERRVQGVLRRVTRCHSHLLPAEDYDAFEWAVTEAYRDVFGTPSDADALRDLIVKFESGTTMPRAHAAMFALQDLSRIIASDVGDRAAAYYRGRRTRARG